MPHLGHAARLRAHIRPILKGVNAALEKCKQEREYDDLLASLNEDENIAWSYGKHSSQREPYDRIPYTSKDILVESHEEIASKIAKWINDRPTDRELEEAAAQMQDLATMAWKIERQKRKQDKGSAYLTLDVDPVTIRLLAMTGFERQKRDGESYEANMIFEEARFRKILRQDNREQIKEARKALQAIMDAHGDLASGIGEEHTVVSSDIPHLRGYRIEIRNGSARSVSRYTEGPVRWINSDRIALNVTLPEVQRASAEGAELERLIDHPLTKNLGLETEKTTLLIDANGNSHEIRTNAWRKNKLVAMVINMKP